mmetsp:Transcript_27437/g.88179  ORF Transcript_27437/g.88179 Transcript_27437/m.88179 type:complete len:343 (+) Transcript_27437:1624-2652(+)
MLWHAHPSVRPHSDHCLLDAHPLSLRLRQEHGAAQLIAHAIERVHHHAHEEVHHEEGAHHEERDEEDDPALIVVHPWLHVDARRVHACQHDVHPALGCAHLEQGAHCGQNVVEALRDHRVPLRAQPEAHLLARRFHVGRVRHGGPAPLLGRQGGVRDRIEDELANGAVQLVEELALARVETPLEVADAHDGEDHVEQQAHHEHVQDGRDGAEERVHHQLEPRVATDHAQWAQRAQRSQGAQSLELLRTGQEGGCQRHDHDHEVQHVPPRSQIRVLVQREPMHHDLEHHFHGEQRGGDNIQHRQHTRHRRVWVVQRVVHGQRDRRHQDDHHHRRLKPLGLHHR